MTKHKNEAKIKYEYLGGGLTPLQIAAKSEIALVSKI
jgi:hypothetical protein